MDKNDLKYKIGISLIPGIGPVNAKKLVAYTGSIEGVFSESGKNLKKIPGIGSQLAKNITNKSILSKAEEEVEFINEYKIQTYFYLDKNYPERLKHCEDAPVMLFQKGKCNLNKQKVVSIVGTRNATQYGKNFCDDFISALQKNHPETVIVSGLAYGIDVTAHKSALRHKMETVAILAHGFKTLYPSAHRPIAKKIVNQGALITEFLSKDLPEKNNFVKRNRIIAGLADATIVVESGPKGGALITADIANSYNRDVLAVPGRTTDKWSKGCNQLIISNKAALLENVSDLEYMLGWEVNKNEPASIQKELFAELNKEEQSIVHILKENGDLTIDQISIKIQFPVSKVSSLLLGLEFKGIVKSLPGRLYKLFH